MCCTSVRTFPRMARGWSEHSSGLFRNRAVRLIANCFLQKEGITCKQLEKRQEEHRGPDNHEMVTRHPAIFQELSDTCWHSLPSFHVGEERLLLMGILLILNKVFVFLLQHQVLQHRDWAAPTVYLTSLPTHVLLLFALMMTQLEHKPFRRHFQELLYAPVPVSSCQLALRNPGISRQAHTHGSGEHICTQQSENLKFKPYMEDSFKYLTSQDYLPGQTSPPRATSSEIMTNFML